ncbi:hypothetical protein QBC39DRAFT_135027 [Podospora conica]|nr:hypothetical protein QBC39DRAFT_135027 [Schizothecium conicum]
MPPSHSLQITLAHRPTSGIIPNHTFAPVTVPVPSPSSLAPGHLLLETLYLSLDPAMRGWIEDKRSYLPPVKIGAVMRAYGLARVLASTSSRAQPGDLVAGTFGMAEVVVVPEALVEEVNPATTPGGKVTDVLGVLGMTGLTAYFGMTKIGAPKAGETVVVTAAAGATGSVAAQIAKIAGARVVGIAGSEEKVRWLVEEVGVDVGLDYNDPEFKAKFARATPNFVDVFWDNVGGEQLEMGLARANKFARFVMCGGISQYNEKEKKGPKNYLAIVSMRIKMQGFIVLDHVDEYAEARKQLAQWLSEGKIKRKETLIKGGLKNVEEAFECLFKGKNIGKLLLEVKAPEEASKL